jgi:hypothetical protein
MNLDGDQCPVDGLQKPEILRQIGDACQAKCGREWRDMRGCEETGDTFQPTRRVLMIVVACNAISLCS